MESSKRLTPATSQRTLSVPIAFWEAELERARERTAELRTTGPHGVVAVGDVATALHELELTFEELSVADEELRTQNDELHRARVLLEQEHARYRELFEQAPMAYLVTDGNGAIRDANHAATRLLRRREGHLIGKPLVVFAPYASRRRIRGALVALREKDLPESFVVTLSPRDEQSVQVEATLSTVRDASGEIVEVRWLLVDRTQQQRRQRARIRHGRQLEALVAERTGELERATHLKDQLIATVSHEFRTALSAIGGYADLLAMGLRGPMTDAQREDVRRILQAYQHLARVVDDLADYSRLTARTLPIEIDDIYVGDALRSIGDLVAPQAAARQIAVHLDQGPASAVVRADPDRLRQIVLNLLGNAVKFSRPNGEARLGWSVDGDAVLISVTDEGIGIPHGQTEAIFEPFVRLGPRDGAPGTGLGLSISRNLARAMGGEVTVSSEVDRGSRFVLRLPRSTRFAVRPEPG